MKTTITYAQLRELVKSTKGMKLPTFKQISGSEEEVLIREVQEDITVTIYKNGFFTYEKNGEATVQRVDYCDCYSYKFQDSQVSKICREQYDNCPFMVRLFMEGESRLEHNRNEKANYYHEFSAENDGNDWCDKLSTPNFVETMERDVADMEEDRRLYAALERLTKKQKQMVDLYYYQRKTMDEIAEELGCTRRNVGIHLEAALNKLKKYF